jgi:hypothetical protein
MPEKNILLEKIENLVLITEENRQHLVETVNNLADDEELQMISDLISQEPEIIKSTLHEVIEAGIETGDRELFTIIEDSIKKLQEENTSAFKDIEKEETQDDQTSADQLLDQMDS